MSLAPTPVTKVVLGSRGGRGPQGNQGSPGANTMATGPFSSLAGQTIPTGTDILHTSGATRGIVIRDDSLTDADVAAHAPAVVKTVDGRYRRRDTKYLDVQMLGADPSGSSDSHGAFQAMSDYLRAFAEQGDGSGAGVAPGILPPGAYRINSTWDVGIGDVSGIGSGASGATLAWGGAAGGTVVRYGSDVNNLSHGGLQNLAIYGDVFAGQTAAKVIDFTQVAAGTVFDKNFLLSRLFLRGASDVLIDVGPWVNIDWPLMRLEGGAVAAIRATQSSGASQSSFRMGFTADNKQSGAGVGRSFMKLITTGNTNIGNVHLYGGRFELNGAYTNERAIFDHSSGGEFLTANFMLSDMGIGTDADAAAVLNSLVYINDTVANYGRLSVRNVGFTNPTAWRAFGGNVAAAQPNPVIASYNNFDAAPDAAFNTAALGLITAQNGAIVAGSVKQAGDAYNRVELRAGAAIALGTGAAAPDTVISRYGNGNIAVGPGGIYPVLRIVPPPANSGSAGAVGDGSFDAGYFYICVGANTWRRVAVGTF